MDGRRATHERDVNGTRRNERDYWNEKSIEKKKRLTQKKKQIIHHTVIQDMIG